MAADEVAKRKRKQREDDDTGDLTLGEKVRYFTPLRLSMMSSPPLLSANAMH